jgi:hypothetical protein
MKTTRIITLTLLFTISATLQAQLFNSPKTLGKGGICLGIEPTVYSRGSSDFLLFVHGGVGLTRSTDLSLHAGIGNPNYLGADLEWTLAHHLTLVTGAHNYDYFGLNSSITYLVPLGSAASFWFGADMNIDFADPDVQVPLWIPVGVEVAFKDKISFLLESEIALTDPARHIIGGGLVFHLR